MSNEEAKRLLDLAKQATTQEEALRLAGEAVSIELLAAMEAAGIAKADQTVDALKQIGLDRLLADALAHGRLRYPMVVAEIDRFRKGLAARTLAASDIKLGILAFDESAQRLALAAGKTGPFQYPTSGNRSRDSLITFARSLHR